MSKKRFTMDYEPIYQNYMYFDNGNIMTEMKVITVLNQQQDDINYLEEYAGDLEYDNRTLQEENKKLKNILNKLEPAIEERGYDNTEDFW